MHSRRAFSFVSIIAALIFVCIFFPLSAMPPGTVPGSTETVQTDSKAGKVSSDTLADTRKNIVSVDILILYPGIGYSRIVPISKKTGLVFYGSITPWFGFVIDTGAALTLGKNHHFFEPGGGYLIRADNFYIKTGYRYQGQSGFVFRIAPGYSITENVPWFTASFGYAF